ncbi:hypothetical protein DPMN_133548 [Dreissena polymorpha]|uniref:Uncharacterized protein n=1 Tax=Dreissena polymorpha TaxID=45954 RepID=A0A9D4J9W1_DREPO|nr:hypothetical protein DPMN_133548 [Dreissena polymorpha]
MIGQKIKLPPGSHAIQLTGTIFELNSRIKETNVLTKFHENWAKNVTSRVFACFHNIHIEKNAPPTGGHVFLPIWTIFELVRDINKTNALTNCHDDWAKIVTYRVFTKKTALPSGGLVYQRSGTTFELNQHIIKANILTKFHENRAKNVTSRVEKCPAHWRPCFPPIWTIFELVRVINKTNVLTNFHDGWAKIVTSRVFTRFLYSQIGKTAPPTGGHVFQRTQTTFELNQHIIKTNILTKLHEDWARNVTSTVFTSFDRDFIGTKLLTKFHEDRTRNVASRVFTNKSHLSNQFHEDWTIIVTLNIRKNAPPLLAKVFNHPPVGQGFQSSETVFELVQDIIGTIILRKFHEDPTINVAYPVLTRKIFMTHNGRQWTKGDHKNSP